MKIRGGMMKLIYLNELYEFSVKTMEACGMNHKDACTVADVLVCTDTFGVMTHGTQNLYGYAQKMLAGGLNAKAQPTVEKQGPAWAVLNGNMAMGMVSASRAMELAIEKAKNVGVAYVGVKNSCHFGAAGYYANMAAQAGMIGIAMSNTDPIMAVPGGCGVSIGSNPFSYAAPTGNGRSVFLDISLSNVAALKVVMAKEKGEILPDGCLVDYEGKPTTDPNTFPQNSSLMPMAAHKGYGLAVMVEILSAVLTSAGILSQVKSWNMDMATPNNVGHALIAIDVKQMMDKAEFESRMEELCQELHSAKRAAGTKQIYMPGEMEWAKREKALTENTIELNDMMVKNMEKLAEQFQLELNWAK
jgi:ureidoglycolate dehydrogenase (NAD+)